MPVIVVTRLQLRDPALLACQIMPSTSATSPDQCGTARAVIACAAVGAHDAAGAGPSPWAGGRSRISAAWVISSSSKATRTPEMDRPAALAKSQGVRKRCADLRIS
jgi:hypothetical protein